MGRYTTVQAFADNNPNMRAVDYAQATGTSSSSAAANRGPVIAEKVDNPYGSTAGAGSGEFHVYRHARAREMERWKKINADEAEMRAEAEFKKKLAHDTKAEEEKTGKRRRKRERAKESKRRKKNMRLGGVVGGFLNADHGGDAEEEFEYMPVAASEIAQDAVKSNSDDSEKAEGSAEKEDKGSGCRKPPPEKNDKVLFANDGSFLERMKRELVNKK